MRPLFHPSVEDIRPEAILHALSDPVRVALFSLIAEGQTTQNCASLACLAGKSVPKSSLSQHFRILREAGLIRSLRQGVEMRNESRCGEVNERFPGLIPAILSAYASTQATAA